MAQKYEIIYQWGDKLFQVKKSAAGKIKYLILGMPLLQKSFIGVDYMWTFLGIQLFGYRRFWDCEEYRVLGVKKVRLLNYVALEDVDLRHKPVEPWAFIRVKDEMKTIAACLNSITPVIKKGVIGFNDCSDGSKEFILDFCKKNPGFIAFEYPYSVLPGNTEGAEHFPSEQRLDGYYNAVLAKIPQNEWIIKIDCDHVYDTEKLRQMFYLPKSTNDCVVLSRLNLHYYDGELYMPKERAFCNSGDHWIVFNKNLKYRFKKVDDDPYYKYYEVLDLEGHNFIFTDCTNWHFPFLKAYRQGDADKFDVFKNYRNYLTPHTLQKIPADMLDENRIKKICMSFCDNR